MTHYHLLGYLVGSIRHMKIEMLPHECMGAGDSSHSQLENSGQCFLLWHTLLCQDLMVCSPPEERGSEKVWLCFLPQTRNLSSSLVLKYTVRLFFSPLLCLVMALRLFVWYTSQTMSMRFVSFNCDTMYGTKTSSAWAWRVLAVPGFNTCAAAAPSIKTARQARIHGNKTVNKV